VSEGLAGASEGTDATSDEMAAAALAFSFVLRNKRITVQIIKLFDRDRWDDKYNVLLGTLYEYLYDEIVTGQDSTATIAISITG
jgi:hypothetical protein